MTTTLPPPSCFLFALASEQKKNIMPKAKGKKRRSAGGREGKKRKPDEKMDQDEFLEPMSEDDEMVAANNDGDYEVDADDEAGKAALARRIAEAEEAEGTVVRDPRRNRGAEDLECDPRAYAMLRTLNVEWPYLSFDVLEDDGGDGRTVFPHSMVAVCGSQAAEKAGNKLTLLRVDGLRKVKVDDDDSDDDDRDLDDDSDDDDEPPRATVFEVAHPGAVRRVAAASSSSRGIVATWSDDDAKIRLWDLRSEATAYCQGNSKKPTGMHTKTVFGSVNSDAPGYALNWSKMSGVAPRLAAGDDRGTVLACSLRSEGGGLDVIAKWTSINKQSVEDVAWSPSEATVLMAVGSDRAVKVYDTRHATRRDPMLTRPEAHSDDINCLSWNASVSYLVATGGDDGLIQVWDLRAFGTAAKPVGTFDYHKSHSITSLQWDPNDESAIAVAASDDAVTLWDLSVEDEVEPPLDNKNTDDLALPPQLLFVHQGIHDPKEVKHHPQIPGCLITTAANGLSLFIPALQGK